MISVNARRIGMLATFVFGFIVRGEATAQFKAPSGPPQFTCVADPHGVIDFEGELGSATGSSNVKILQASDIAEYYVGTIASELGSSVATQKRIESVAELNDVMRQATRVPAMLASAHTALFVAGEFKCLGFAPGRYIFLSEVYGGRGHVGDAPAATVYYRADVDVSSIKRHSIVVVRGFRRIGSYPPGS